MTKSRSYFHFRPSSQFPVSSDLCELIMLITTSSNYGLFDMIKCLYLFWFEHFFRLLGRNFWILCVAFLRPVLELMYYILFLKVTKSQELFSFPIHLQKIKLQSINFLSQMNLALKGDKISEFFLVFSHLKKAKFTNSNEFPLA